MNDLIFVLSVSGLFKGKLGLKNGTLAPCPNRPNCVASQGGDKKHHIPPISYKGPRKNALIKLKKVINSMQGATLVDETKEYLRVEFRSKVFGFVDDTEFYLPDKGQVIHLRSASRLGYSDLGANRKRLEKVRSLFNKMK